MAEFALYHSVVALFEVPVVLVWLAVDQRNRLSAALILASDVVDSRVASHLVLTEESRQLELVVHAKLVGALERVLLHLKHAFFAKLNLDALLRRIGGILMLAFNAPLGINHGFQAKAALELINDLGGVVALPIEDLVRIDHDVGWVPEWRRVQQVLKPWLVELVDHF